MAGADPAEPVQDSHLFDHSRRAPAETSSTERRKTSNRQASPFPAQRISMQLSPAFMIFHSGYSCPLVPHPMLWHVKTGSRCFPRQSSIMSLNVTSPMYYLGGCSQPHAGLAMLHEESRQGSGSIVVSQCAMICWTLSIHLLLCDPPHETIMAPRTSIVVFGDQTEDPSVLIRDFSRRSHQSLAAQTFLQRSSDALRDMVLRVPQPERPASHYSFQLL